MSRQEFAASTDTTVPKLENFAATTHYVYDPARIADNEISEDKETSREWVDGQIVAGLEEQGYSHPDAIAMLNRLNAYGEAQETQDQ
ncbi:MAG TPA: hypothetical protein VHT70_04235 [Candidatus Saccharimonadales bacterium]|jgi:hypothetical protein|nr:hypothetical protein [Candidatus Saccharimonadales bacterium]